MTQQEFDAWWQAFLAAMQGGIAGQNANGVYRVCDPQHRIVADNSHVYADAALDVWREKRKAMTMPEVNND